MTTLATAPLAPLLDRLFTEAEAPASPQVRAARGQLRPQERGGQTASTPEADFYPAVLALLEEHLKPGALIVADNAGRSPEYLQRVRSAAGGYTSVPFAGDVELSMRAG